MDDTGDFGSVTFAEVKEHLVSRLMMDEEWTVDNDSSLSWWPTPLVMNIEAVEEGMFPDSNENWIRVRACTPIAPFEEERGRAIAGEYCSKFPVGAVVYSPATVGLADKILQIVRLSDPHVELKFNKFYIGLAKEGLATNYVAFRPRKKHLIVEIRLPRTEQTTALIEESGIGTLAYVTRWSNYRLTLTAEELDEHRELIAALIGMAREHYNS